MDTLDLEDYDRLSKAINKLKNQLISQEPAVKYISVSEKDNFSKERDKLNKEDNSEQLDLADNENIGGWNSQEDKSLSKSYLTWENNANLCWLDSSMSLLVHNKSVSRLVNDNSSQISKILKGYESAISVFNDYSNQSSVGERLEKAKNILQKVQETVLDYLKPILKFKEGEPDSAFCSLLNLISENEQIKNLFSVEFFWLMNCVKCAVPRIENKKKTIITLSKLNEFNPSSPVSLYKCRFCESTDQEREIKFKTLPRCLIFHFENGAGEGELDSLDFELNDRKYKLSGLIKLERSRDLEMNHYVAWVKDIATDSWLECNDLSSDILSYGVIPPLINLKDLCIILYEALDERGTIANISIETDHAIKMGVDDASSSDIPVIELSDEDEGTVMDQPNQIDTEISNTMFIGGLFKHDETDCDSDEKMSKRLDISDSVFKEKNTLSQGMGHFDSSCSEENNTSSKKEKLSADNSELDNLSLQTKVLSTLNKKIDLKTDEVSSDSLITNLENGSKNGLDVYAVANVNESLVKNNIEMSIKNVVKPYIFDSNVKISKEITDKPLSRASSNIEKLALPTDTEDNVSGERNISSGSEKDYSVVLNMYPFKNQDNKNAECLLKIPTEYQNNQLCSNGLVEINNCNMNSPINANEDCAGESCGRTASLPIYHRVKKKIALNTKLAIEKFKTVENENITKDGALDFLAPCTSHCAEETILIPTSPDLTLPTSDTEKQPQDPYITRLSILPETLADAPSKSANDLFLEEMPVVTRIQNIDAKLLERSHMLGKKDDKVYPTEINKEYEFITTEHNHNTSNLLAPLNPTDKKSSVNHFEDKAHSNITGDMVAKHTDNSVEEMFIEDGINFYRKLNKVNAKSLEEADLKLSENENPTSSVDQTKIPNDEPLGQSQKNLASSVNINEQINVKPVENENISLKRIVKQRLRKLKEEHIYFPEWEQQVKNLPLKIPFVQITRLKDTEIANHVSTKVTCAEAKQNKSLEELTKTVVVKVEKTDPNSILRRKDEQAGPSRIIKVESIPIRKSSRIRARQIKQAENVKKSSLVTISKNNSEIQPANIFIKQKLETLPEVAEKTLKNEDLSKRTYGTHSCPEVHSDVSNDVFSQKRAKKKHFEEIKTDENIKSKRQRTQTFEVDNAAIQSHPPTALLLESTSSTEHFEFDNSLQAHSSNEYCSTLTNKNDSMIGQEIVNTDNHIQPDNNGLELHSNKCAPNCECNNLQLHEIIEISCNSVIASVFEFFHFQ